MKILLVGMAVLFAGWVLVGCGGGGGNSSNSILSQGNGEITSSDMLLVSGAYGDTIRFTAKHNGWVCVEMTSTAIDALLGVWSGDTDTVTADNFIGSDDNSGGNLNARFNFTAQAGNVYSVRLTTTVPDEFGSYAWKVYEVDAPVPSAFSHNLLPWQPFAPAMQ